MANSDVTPVRRNLRFRLPKNRVNDWHSQGVHVTTFMNCLSIFFPVGEQFFIDSVAAYKQALADHGSPLLRQQVKEFSSQESYHTREHELLNDALSPHFAVQSMEAVVQSILSFFRFFSRSLCLGGTIALEHLTSTLGHIVLSDPSLLEGCEVHYASLWNWHAMEEVEHKGVCYDVYEQIFPRASTFSYVLRCVTFVIANAIFLALFAVFYTYMIWMQGKLFDTAGWRQLLRLLFGGSGRTGIAQRMWPIWWDYFRPNFHPWQHDDRHLLAGMPALLSTAQGFGKAAAGEEEPLKSD